MWRAGGTVPLGQLACDVMTEERRNQDDVLIDRYYVGDYMIYIDAGEQAFLNHC